MQRFFFILAILLPLNLLAQFELSPLYSISSVDQESVIAIASWEDLVAVAGTFDGRLSPSTKFDLETIGRDDIFILLYEEGSLISAISAGSKDNDIIADIAFDSSGHLHVFGNYESEFFIESDTIRSSIGNTGMFVLELDSMLRLVNGRSISGSGIENATAISTSNDSTIGLAFYYSGQIQLGSQLFVSSGQISSIHAKLHPANGWVWANSYASDISIRASALAIDVDGNHYLAANFRGTLEKDLGSVSSAANGEDILILSTDKNGVLSWSNTITGSLPDAANALCLDNENNLYATGSFSGNFRTSILPPLQSDGVRNDIFLYKCNSNGQPIFLSRYGGADNESAIDIVNNSDELYVLVQFTNSLEIAGKSTQTAGDRTNSAIVKISSTTASGQDLIPFLGDDFMLIQSLSLLDNDKIAVGGTFLGSAFVSDPPLVSEGFFDGFWGVVSPVASSINRPELPLVQLYPNPCSTVICGFDNQRYMYADCIEQNGRIEQLLVRSNCIDISRLAAGSYEVLIKDISGNIIAVSRIVKL